DLFFRRVAIARHGLFNFPGCVFKNGNVIAECRRHRHTLGTAEFEHDLNVLSVKGSFQRHTIGLILCNEGTGLLKNPLQLKTVVVEVAKLNDAEANQRKLIPSLLQDTITQYGGSRIDT